MPCSANATTRKPSSYAAAARRVAAAPLPLRVAEAFDGLALPCVRPVRAIAGRCAWVAVTPGAAARGAVAHPRPGLDLSLLPPVLLVRSWVVNDQLSPEGADAAGRLRTPPTPVSAEPGRAVDQGSSAPLRNPWGRLTSKEIAERLYPRRARSTITWLQIYRRLDIPSRSKLAALMADEA